MKDERGGLHHAPIRIDAGGRFGAMYKAAANMKHLSVDDIKGILITRHKLGKGDGATYEHQRKLIENQCGPGKELLPLLCKILDLNLKEAQTACTWDEIGRKHGEKVIAEMMGKDPRLPEFEKRLPLLTDQERDWLLNQMDGVINSRTKAAHAGAR